MTNETTATDTPEVVSPVEVELPATIELTRQGFDQLQQDLSILRDVQRPDLEKQLQRATLFMDLETGEGVANVARYDLAVLDKQISHLEAVIERAQVAEPKPGDTTVQLGSQVTVRYEGGTEETLTVVGPLEADPQRGYVSGESPAGKALLGKSAGAGVNVGTADDSLSLVLVTVTLDGEVAASDQL
jgi:transcription elongation factor GreA